MAFTVLFDIADLVTDLLFIWSNVQRGNLSWAYLSTGILGFHLVFIVFSQFRSSQRNWVLAFAAIFQLHVAYGAYQGDCVAIIMSFDFVNAHSATPPSSLQQNVPVLKKKTEHRCAWLAASSKWTCMTNPTA
jgi:uncharacterized membrane protein